MIKELWRKPDLDDEDALPQSARYRGLRGIARHIVGTGGNSRSGVSPLGSAKGEKRNWGTCKWCGLPTGKRRLWHDECSSYYFSAQAQPSGRGAIHGEMVEIENPYGGTSKRALCPACGKAAYVHMELDHIMAIGVARRLGLPFFKRAFLPENLWWICEPCHRAKTAFDRAFMRSLDNTEEGEESAAAMPDEPLFEWAAQRKAS